MNKEQMIEKIYKEIANKELSFGCKVRIEYDSSHHCFSDYINIDENTYWKQGGFGLAMKTQYEYDFEKEDIIGHPVKIGDVLDWWTRFGYTNNGHLIKITDSNDLHFLFAYWDKLRKPIEDQSEECIRYVYSLIPESGEKK